MNQFSPRALATGIGSLPHREPGPALDLVFRTCPEIPFWPQLPRRDLAENMYAQFSEDLPSVRLDRENARVGAVVGENVLGEAEAFYARYLAEDPSFFAIGQDYAAGLYAFRQKTEELAKATWIKGQVTGPISLGLEITDQSKRPILYDDTLRDVLVKHIARKAQWHAQFLSPVGKTLTFVDEPSLSLIGASFVALNRDEVIRDLEEVYGAIQGVKGTHCCGNTDWSLLLQTSVDIISFDAYSYAENLALFSGDVGRFLDRGGVLAWGIVPTVEEVILQETPDHLVDCLDAAMHLLVKKGLDRDLLFERCLITPACGMGTLSISTAERALELTAEVSRKVRVAHGY